MVQQYFTETHDDLQEFAEAIYKVVGVIGCTMGPFGSFVTIDAKGSGILSIKDGATVASYQAYEDPIEALASKMVVDACKRTETYAGDGTTHTAVLINYLLKDALELFNSQPDMNRHSFVRGMEKGMQAVIASLEEKATKIVNKGVIDEDLLHKVAMVSANYDEKIASMISSLVADVGVHGRVLVNMTDFSETTVKRHAGYTYKKGLLSTMFYNEPGASRLFKPFVVIINEIVERVEQIAPILEAWNHTGNPWVQPVGNDRVINHKPLVFVVKAMTGDALAMLVKNKSEGTHKIAVVEGPSSGGQTVDFYQDLSIVTNTGRVFDEHQGEKLNTFDIMDIEGEFGQCKEFFATDNEVVFYFDKDMKTYGEETLKDSIDRRISELQGDIDRYPEREETVRQRISMIAGAVGIVYVGGRTEAERRRLYTVIDDVKSACFAALEEGIIPGGGIELLRFAIHGHPDVPPMDSKEEALGFNTFLKGIAAPIRTICENRDDQVFADIMQAVEEGLGENETFDLIKDEFGDAVQLGVIDPVRSVNQSLKASMSVISNVIRTRYFQILKMNTNGQG